MAFPYSTAIPHATKARDEVFESISPIRKSKSPAPSVSNLSSLSQSDSDLSSSSTEDDENKDENEDGTLPPWLLEPADFPKKNDIWQLLFNFGLEFLHSVKSRKGYSITKKNNYDYIEDIKVLVNLESHTLSKSNVSVSDDYQIITPEGWTLSPQELKELVSPLIEIDAKKQVICKAPVCGGKCGFEIPHNDMTGRRHIIDTVLGITFHCVRCGGAFKGKSSLQDHAKNCTYTAKASLENAATREKYQESTDVLKVKKLKTEHPNPIPIIDKMEEKCIDFLRLAFQQFRHSEMISIKRFSKFKEYIKKNLDYNFFVFFRDLIAPAAYGGNLYHLDDTGFYYGIFLCNKLQKINNDPSKSVRFRILSINDCEYKSIHILLNMRVDTLRSKPKTCCIDGCVCKNTFEADDPTTIVGHVLEKNYLIVCEGCKKGIPDWTYFMQHFTKDCFIKRPVRKDVK